MIGRRTDERGAALIYVLLIMALLIAFITGFLVVVQSEARQGAFARTTTSAFEIADAGIDEAIARMEAGLQFRYRCADGQSFQNSLSPSAANVVCVQYTQVYGQGAARWVILSTARVGAATRRVAATIQQITTRQLSKIVLGDRIYSSGNANVFSGDVYSRTSVNINKGLQAGAQVYAGYFIKDRPPAPLQLWYSKYTPGSAADCSYRPDPQPPACVVNPAVPADWWPSHRLAVWRSSARGQEIASAPTGTTYDGLRYRVYTDTLLDDTGAPQQVNRLHVIYEDWFDLYWTWSDVTNAWEKSAVLQADPRRGAVPPFPDINAFMSSCDVCYPDGGIINGGTIGSATDPKLVVFGTPGGPPVDAHINGNATGYGLMIVNGNLQINGNFTWNGLILVKGTVTIGNGTATVNGGLVADDAVILSGTIDIYAGSDTIYPPAGPSDGIVLSWWER